MKLNFSVVGDGVFLFGVILLILTLQGFVKSRSTTVEEASLSLHHVPTSFSDRVALLVPEVLKTLKERKATNSAGVDAFESSTLRAVGSVLTNEWRDTNRTLEEMGIFRVTSERAEALAVLVASKRSEPKEAFVVAIPVDPFSLTSASLGVSLATTLRTVPWLGKNAIFLFFSATDASPEVLEQILDNFSRIPRGFHELLRLGLVLQVDDTLPPGDVRLDIEGKSGKLPNQDLVNVFISESLSIAARIKISHSSGFGMVRNLAFERNIALHEGLLARQIPAFTVRASSHTQRQGLIRPLEVFLRAMSGSTQTLHHSFNFYLFVGKARHISNSSYCIPLVFLVVACFLWAYTHVCISSFVQGFGWLSVLLGVFLALFGVLVKSVSAVVYSPIMANQMMAVCLLSALSATEALRPVLARHYATVFCSTIPVEPFCSDRSPVHLLIASFLVSSMVFDVCKMMTLGMAAVLLFRFGDVWPSKKRFAQLAATCFGFFLLWNRSSLPSNSLLAHILVLAFIGVAL